MAEFNHDLWVGIVTAAPVAVVVFSQSLSDLLTANEDVGSAGRELTYRWIVSWVYATPVGGGLLTLWAAISLLVRRDCTANDVIGVIALGAVLFGAISATVQLRRLQLRLRRRGTPPDDHPATRPA